MLLAWSTHKGVYKKRLPFGTKPACAIFQQATEERFKGLARNYFNDMIVTGRNRKEHLEKLEKVLSKARIWNQV